MQKEKKGQRKEDETLYTNRNIDRIHLYNMTTNWTTGLREENLYV